MECDVGTDWIELTLHIPSVVSLPYIHLRTCMGWILASGLREKKPPDNLIVLMSHRRYTYLHVVLRTCSPRNFATCRAALHYKTKAMLFWAQECELPLEVYTILQN